MVGFGLLTAAGIVSIGKAGQGIAALFVLQASDPVGLVVAVGLDGAFGITRPVRR